MDPAWRSRYEVARGLAAEAAQLARRYFDADVTVDWKQDASPVTVADREAELLLRTGLLRHFPDDGFLGEEYGEKPGSTGFRWIIDPIDGTRSFVRGIPLWGTLVGLEFRGEPIAGVVELPALGQTFCALRGDGAFRNDRRLRVSEVSCLSEATFFYTGLRYFDTAGQVPTLLRVARQAQNPRGFGDVYGFMLVAQGAGEFMLEHGVHVWDIAAVLPIIEEAGGRLTDWTGQRTVLRPDVLASNGRLHDDVLRLIRPTAGG
ncbi:MAG: histidinol phosphate phosphatase [Gemmataceae bacterium]|nr:histidinol phosphate phosphatase [Gemmataceae bacterium]MDW8267219.1 inositol monophosphatase family protein [Gemmataceae bacterium]